MAICKYCKEKIDYLCYFALVETDYTYSVDDGQEEFDETDRGDHLKCSWYCPSCNKRLFIDQDKAKKFLENKEE